MDLNLEGKNVAIVGGTSGIGRMIAIKMLQEGCNVGVCGKNPQKVKDINETLHSNDFISLQADAVSLHQLYQFGSEVIKAFGSIDIWINNVGVNGQISIMNASPSEVDYMLDVNIKTVFYGCKVAAELMNKYYPASEGNEKVIINTSSFAAEIPSAGTALYAASKSAVSSLTRTAAGEFASKYIRVVSIVPGVIDTEMSAPAIAKNGEALISQIAQRRIGTTEEIADVYVFLASHAARYINGTDIQVTGGKFCTQNPMWSW